MCFINYILGEKGNKENISALIPVKGQATYLLWIDCKKLGIRSVELADIIRKKRDFICQKEKSIAETE